MEKKLTIKGRVLTPPDLAAKLIKVDDINTEHNIKQCENWEWSCEFEATIINENDK